MPTWSCSPASTPPSTKPCSRAWRSACWCSATASVWTAWTPRPPPVTTSSCPIWPSSACTRSRTRRRPSSTGQGRQIALCDRLMHQGQWAEIRPRMRPVHRMNQQTLGLIGFGRIGKEVAKRMRPAMGRVVAHDPWAQAPRTRARIGSRAVGPAIGPSGLRLHLRARAAVAGHAGPRRLGRTQANEAVHLSNQHDAAVVSSTKADLIRVLQEDRIAGAALDVFEEEPMPADHPFRSMERVTLTPHTWGVPSTPTSRAGTPWARLFRMSCEDASHRTSSTRELRRGPTSNPHRTGHRRSASTDPRSGSAFEAPTAPYAGQTQSRFQGRAEARIQGWCPMRSRRSPMDTSVSSVR